MTVDLRSPMPMLDEAIQLGRAHTDRLAGLAVWIEALAKENRDLRAELELERKRTEDVAANWKRFRWEMVKSAEELGLSRAEIERLLARAGGGETR